MHHLADTELIVTPQGHIYHLDLHPDQLADFIITVGDPGRVAQVSKHFDAIEHRASHREFVTHTGRIGNQRVSVISTGIGPDNIDIVLNELDALVNIDLQARELKPGHRALKILRLGTSGGLQTNIKPGSLVFSKYAIGLDNLLHFYNYPASRDEKSLLSSFEKHLTTMGQTLPTKPYACAANTDLLEHFAGDFSRCGITLTCPGFYAPQGRSLRTKSQLSRDFFETVGEFNFDGLQITNFEMETAAILGLANLLGHHALSCSVILGNRLDGQFLADPGKAVEAMIEGVLRIGF
jgi:uridine phosphorylase